MLAIDTNILVYAADRSCPEHAPCLAVLERCRTGPIPWYLTWSVVYEFLRVVTHPQVFRSPWTLHEALAFVDALLASPTLRLLDHTARHAETLAEVAREVPGVRGNLVHDAHLAAQLKEHGVRRVCTRDTHFHRFPFLDVVDPLA